MHLPTHLLIGWLVANSDRLGRRDRAIVTLAGVIPDLDGLGAVVEVATRHSTKPLLWWSKYHHLFGHNILAGAACAAFGVTLGMKRWRTALLAYISFHVHLICDIAGARGPDGDQWPIPYLFPFSSAWQFAWDGQWALNAWPNILITCVALALTFHLAWKRGYSPVGMLSLKADKALVETLRKRYPHPDSARG